MPPKQKGEVMEDKNEAPPAEGEKQIKKGENTRPRQNWAEDIGQANFSPLRGNAKEDKGERRGGSGHGSHA